MRIYIATIYEDTWDSDVRHRTHHKTYEGARRSLAQGYKQVRKQDAELNKRRVSLAKEYGYEVKRNPYIHSIHEVDLFE